jgi:hypothetical protein
MAATAPSLPSADLLARRRAIEAILTELVRLTARPVPRAVTEALQDLLARRLSLEEYLRRFDEIQQAFSAAAGPTWGRYYTEALMQVVNAAAGPSPAEGWDAYTAEADTRVRRSYREWNRWLARALESPTAPPTTRATAAGVPASFP